MHTNKQTASQYQKAVTSDAVIATMLHCLPIGCALEMHYQRQQCNIIQSHATYPVTVAPIPTKASRLAASQRAAAVPDRPFHAG